LEAIVRTIEHIEQDLTLVVDKKVSLATDIVSLELRDPQGRDLPEWSAGAHIDLLLTPQLNRQYSLCGDPDDRKSWKIAVLRETAGRGGSQFIHDELAESGSVEVRGPRNHFGLESAESYLFIAGGIGITPMLPMIALAQRSGASWILHYGGRTRSTMAFVAELVDAYGDRVVVHPQDEQGLLNLDEILASPTSGTLIYSCGPEPLLKAVEAKCASLPAVTLHVERFAPKEVGAPVRAGEFEIELASTGTVLVVGPDQSILDVVEAAGIEVLSSCSEGTCGTCEVRILAGVPEHRDSVFSEAERLENTSMFICVSRAITPRIVLDL
jgi:ferredoxin-NADP reductase